MDLNIVRFDLNHTNPHANPHGQLEIFEKIKNNLMPIFKSDPIYPWDVPHN